ncbi:hypothetical protein Tco_1071413 [Tanacetum coccineum]
MTRQCTKPKRRRNYAWFKEKAMLAEALYLGMVLDEEQMSFLANNGDTVTTSQQSQEIPTLAAFQTDDLDAFDFNCDEAPSASAIPMAKLSSHDSATLSEVPTHDNYLDNHVIDHTMQGIHNSEQLVFNNDTDIDNDITSESNMISYEKYLNETKNMVVQNTSSSTQHESMMMFVIEEMSNQVVKCNEVDKENKMINESLTAELERYKEQIKLFKERQKFDLNDREKYIDGQLRKQHNALSVIDTEETLELAEDSRLKMHAKQNDPIMQEKKVNIAPIDYVALNKLSEHFVKHFVPQKQLYTEQAFWLPISKPVSKIPPVQPEPVLKEIPRELLQLLWLKIVLTK